MNLHGRRFAVIGAGRSGLAAASLLRSAGAFVLISEGSKRRVPAPPGAVVETGGHSNRVLDSDVIVRSPGVPNHLTILIQARKRGIPIWSELELASRFIRPRRMVAITGTNGKTTTTTLVGDLFKRANPKTIVGGNIGTPLAALAGRITAKTDVVLEVSSYQLEDICTFHPQISVILNITPDHLEHHGTLKAYAAAKGRIFENQNPDDVCVLNADDAWCRKLARRSKAKIFWFSRRKKLAAGVFFDKGNVILRWGKIHHKWPLVWLLPGAHNVENALAAVASAAAGGVPIGIIQKGIRSFRGVEHRLEWVRTVDGVRYVNDSKATNVDSTRVALESFSQPLVLIMGGRGKGSSYRPLIALMKKHTKRILLIGEDSPRIERDLRSAVETERCQTLARAVRRARQITVRGDVVLLSPACASFDQYENYEERGRHFKSLVKSL